MGKLPERGVGDSIVPTAASTSERSGKGAPDRVVNRNAMEIVAPPNTSLVLRSTRPNPLIDDKSIIKIPVFISI